jgi:hypothetical protein
MGGRYDGCAGGWKVILAFDLEAEHRCGERSEQEPHDPVEQQLS